jgi:alpha-tubulin suppressor-like RCC1 family protein
MNSLLRVSAAAAVALLVSSCGGGSASSKLTGIFIDSPVAGIGYRTATGSGKTTEKGEFQYELNETVVFSVGSVDLPPAIAHTTVTPLDLANTTDFNHQVVSNILILLQSLDSDGNPDNGIQIPANAPIAASKKIDFNVTTTEFRANADVIKLVANSGSVNKAPVTLAEASRHFQKTLGVANVAPVANPGKEKNVLTKTAVVLNGSDSSDANYDPLTYSWTFASKPAGSSVLLSDALTPSPSFTPDVAGTFVLSLTVNDGKLNSLPVTVKVTSANANVAPVAKAGAAQNVTTNSAVVLDGSASTDANSDILTYAWSFESKPAGSSATFNNSTAAMPRFTADKAGIYVANLTVNDGALSSVVSKVTITVANANVAPVANAGLLQNTDTGSLVALSGVASSDANGDALTYAWSFVSKPAGSNASLSSATAAKPTFVADVDGSYVVRLAVNDGALTSAPSTVTISATTPYVYVTPTGFLSIAAGDSNSSPFAYTVVVKSDSSLWAWGGNDSGQLGDGTFATVLSPKQIGTGYRFVTATTGPAHTLAIKTDGSLWAWGSNSNGQLGTGATTNSGTPTQIGTGYASVGSGTQHTLAVKSDGTLWAWGWNMSGEVGDGTTTRRLSPRLIGNGFSAAGGGSNFSVALKLDGSLWTWGSANNGQLGDGLALSRSLIPKQIGSGFSAISAAHVHTLALKPDGSLWAWGHNYNGSIGDGTTNDAFVPKQIGAGFASIAAGDGFSLAIKSDSSLWAWGDNVCGMLGDGTTTRSLVPKQIGTGYTAVFGSGGQTIATKSDGSLWAWGCLSDGTRSSTPKPVSVP